MKRNVLVIAVCLFSLLLSPRMALADCQIVSRNGDDDTVNCTAVPPDTNGIETGRGDDHVTVQADAVVDSAATTIDTGYGNDIVLSYGIVTSRGDGINLGAGIDAMFIYGPVTVRDDSLWCSPNAGDTCQINVYNQVRATNEAVDVYNRGGRVIVYNEGDIRSQRQEALHLLGTGVYEVINRGYISGGHNTIETNGGGLMLENYGIITSPNQKALDLDTNTDTIINYGTLSSRRQGAIILSGGPDTVINYGIIFGDSTIQGGSWHESTIEGGDGADQFIIAANSQIYDTDNPFASIEAGNGSDRVTIRGGYVENRIYGDPDTGNEAWRNDRDIIRFELSGTTSEIAAFRTQVQAQSAASGSAAWRGNTYQWQAFEFIELALTDTSPTSTPTASATSTSTPTATSTATVTLTVTPTATATTEVSGTPTPTSTATATGTPPTGSTDTPTPTETPIPTEGQPTLTPTVGCPVSAPPGITAAGHTAQASNPRTLELRWEDVSDVCMAVQSFKVIFSYSTRRYEWNFNRADIRCENRYCYATVQVPDTETRLYWRVEAYNSLGTGGSDNSKFWQLP